MYIFVLLEVYVAPCCPSYIVSQLTVFIFIFRSSNANTKRRNWYSHHKKYHFFIVPWALGQLSLHWTHNVEVVSRLCACPHYHHHFSPLPLLRHRLTMASKRRKKRHNYFTWELVATNNHSSYYELVLCHSINWFKLKKGFSVLVPVRFHILWLIPSIMMLRI